MNQPELGKKVAELRKAKGLTQEELVSKCNFTVRTLQRIESGVVTPRSYTIKLLFTALGYDIYNLSESGAEKSASTFLGEKTEQYFKCVMDMFNLKTNTMKKISILSVVIALGFIFFLSGSQSNAQKLSKDNFLKSEGRGIVYFWPRNLPAYISNMKDTADYKVGKYLLQEYRNNIFLNKKFVDKVLAGDTVILKKGKVIIKKSYWQFNSSPDNGIKYFIPGKLTMNYSHWADTNTMIMEDIRIREENHRIFLNGSFVGIANAGDTVILKNGSLTIRSEK